MDKAIVVKGRLTGPRIVELDEPIDDVGSEAEVILRRAASPTQNGQDLIAFLTNLPSGSRTKEDIDRQFAEERSSWDRR